MRILLIDDSEDTGVLVVKCLSPYDVVQAFSLEEATQKLEAAAYDLMLIDVSLPDGNGFQFCENLVREGRFDQIPKMFLTAHSQTSDKVFGLNLGADDYITKPFELAELQARVNSRLRLLKAAAPIAQMSGFEFEPDFQRCSTVSSDGSKRDLQLTPTEYRILSALAKASGKPLSRQEIVRAVWTNNGLNIEKRGIDSHVAHLRKKIEGCDGKIVSVYGKGYALVPAADVASSNAS